jgi:hypothetical protein
MTSAEARELWSQITARAWADDSFKQQLLADPKAVIQAETGIEIPAGFKLSVVEEQPGTKVLVLPANMSELSEEQLELVAAGEMNTNSIQY